MLKGANPVSGVRFVAIGQRPLYRPPDRLHVKRVNYYVFYDLFCYTGRFVYFGAIFILKMKQILRLRTTTGSLPTACKQRMIPDICYGL